jgi:hypothetical protein
MVIAGAIIIVVAFVMIVVEKILISLDVLDYVGDCGCSCGCDRGTTFGCFLHFLALRFLAAANWF